MSDGCYVLFFKMFNALIMMNQGKEVFAQSLGIDVSMDSIDCCFCYQMADRRVVIKGTTKFGNNIEGFDKLLKWLKKWLIPEKELVIAMEATGVYYENLAYFLSDASSYKVCVLLPNMVKSFTKSLNVKSKNDRSDAIVLAKMALERALKSWKAPSKVSRSLVQLCRLRESLLQNKTMISNRLHAKNYSHSADEFVLGILNKQYDETKKHIKDLEAAIRKNIEQDAPLKTAIERLMVIPGVGLFAAATVLAETNHFELFKSKAQVVSYAGLDVIENQSGSSVRGKGRISKKGNSRLRKCLYFPAIVHVRMQSVYTNSFNNILQRTSCKMKAYVAVQRKLLVLMYSLTKNQTTFNPNYHIDRKKTTKATVLMP